MMADFLRVLARFLWRRDSDSALCVIIIIADYLKMADKRHAHEYLFARWENDKLREMKSGSASSRLPEPA